MFCGTDVSVQDDGCSSGHVRIHPNTDTLSSREGRVEICLNSAWGTVCDTLFDDLDAKVACSQMSGFSGQGNSNIHSYSCALNKESHKFLKMLSY